VIPDDGEVWISKEGVMQSFYMRTEEQKRKYLIALNKKKQKQEKWKGKISPLEKKKIDQQEENGHQLSKREKSSAKVEIDLNTACDRLTK
jgi:hypothetical protein